MEFYYFPIEWLQSEYSENWKNNSESFQSPAPISIPFFSEEAFCHCPESCREDFESDTSFLNVRMHSQDDMDQVGLVGTSLNSHDTSDKQPTFQGSTSLITYVKPSFRSKPNVHRLSWSDFKKSLKESSSPIPFLDPKTQMMASQVNHTPDFSKEEPLIRKLNLKRKRPLLNSHRAKDPNKNRYPNSPYWYSSTPKREYSSSITKCEYSLPYHYIERPIQAAPETEKKETSDVSPISTFEEKAIDMDLKNRPTLSSSQKLDAKNEALTPNLKIKRTSHSEKKHTSHRPAYQNFQKYPSLRKRHSLPSLHSKCAAYLQEHSPMQFNNQSKGILPSPATHPFSSFSRPNGKAIGSTLLKLINEEDLEDCKFIDTHCHIDFLFKKANYSKSFKSFMKECESSDCFPKQFEGCVTIFCDPVSFSQVDSWRSLLDEDGIWAAFGCHPHFALYFNSTQESLLTNALKHDKVKAIGEMGLDYSYKNHVSSDVQKEVFTKQLFIALKFKKPVVIHCREAVDDCFQILTKILPNDYIIHWHCFTSNLFEAQRWMNHFPNLYIGFTPILTQFKSQNEMVMEVAKAIPLNRILLETDAPYFRPYYLRGSQYSHPGMAIHVAAALAYLRTTPLKHVLKATRQNAFSVYGI